MRWLIFLFLFWATSALSQSYPEYRSTTVNDYADLLSPDQEAALDQRLTKLRSENGVEMTVLTLTSQATFSAEQSLEAFATGVFDTWGIGDAELNDGVLVLVLRADRAMRIELGAGYGRDWNLAAGRVVDSEFLPYFRQEDYSRGIMNGVDAVIEDIVVPFKAGEQSPVTAIALEKFLGVIAAIAVASIAMIVVIVKMFRNLITRLRKCPQCGRGGLNKTRMTTASASTMMAGAGINRFHCSFCDYSMDQKFTISKVSTRPSRSTRSGFGGGRSGGGGASGRW